MRWSWKFIETVYNILTSFFLLFKNVSMTSFMPYAAKYQFWW